MQALYGILAMSLVSLLSLTAVQSKRKTDTRMVINEAATHATAVGVDILEAAGGLAFDAQTDTLRVFNFPAVSDADELTSEIDFGGATMLSDALDLDDLDGVTIDRTLGEFRYTVTLDVRYVDEYAPDVYTGYQTFAKELRLEIENEHLFVGNRSNPLTIEMSRVFTYQQITSLPGGGP